MKRFIQYIFVLEGYTLKLQKRFVWRVHDAHSFRRKSYIVYKVKTLDWYSYKKQQKIPFSIKLHCSNNFYFRLSLRTETKNKLPEYFFVHLTSFVCFVAMNTINGALWHTNYIPQKSMVNISVDQIPLRYDITLVKQPQKLSMRSLYFCDVLLFRDNSTF